MKKTLLLTAITLLLFSCSNKELDRGNAFDIIKEFYEYPNVEVINFQGVTSSQRLNKEYNNLRGQKFITERRKGKYSNEFWVFMTEKGKAFTLSETEKASYNGYKVASSVLELDEVTGIRFNDGKNTAYIDYNLKRTNVTPFGNSKDYNDGDILKKETVMQLYDDGWRITSSKPDIVKIENVKGFDKGFIKGIEKREKELKEWETSETFGPPDVYGVIVDPDGYSNLRKGKSSKSEIIQKVYTNEKFFIDENVGKWWLVTLNNGKQGYIHKSRIKISEE